MLSHPSFSQQQLLEQQVDRHPQAQHYPDDFGYLSSSLPLPSQQQQQHHHHIQTPTFTSDFLTDSYDPHLFDDICVMEPTTTSSSLPLDEHDIWFQYPSSSQTEEEEGEGMSNANMDPSLFYRHPEGMPTIDEVTVSTNTSVSVF